MEPISLTPRERDCLHWVSQGKTSWEIGKILGIRERTANYHIANFCSKLRVTTRQAAITVAIQQGLLQTASDPPASPAACASRRPASAAKARNRRPAPARSRPARR